MKGLLPLVRWDFILNFRQGIVYAALWIVIMWSILLSLVPDSGREPILFSLLFLEVSIFAFYLMPGFYYLEKAERVHDSLGTTPLPPWVWLVSKTLVFSVMTLVASVAIALVVHGPGLNWGWFSAAVLLSGTPLILVGFALATRYNGVAEYLFPSIPIILILQLPLLSFWEILTGRFWWLFPTMPGLVLLEAAFQNDDRNRALLGLAVGLLYAVPIFWLALYRYRVTAARRMGD